MLGFLDTAYNLQVDLGLEDEQVGDVGGGEVVGHGGFKVQACRFESRTFWQWRSAQARMHDQLSKH